MTNNSSYYIEVTSILLRFNLIYFKLYYIGSPLTFSIIRKSAIRESPCLCVIQENGQQLN